MLYRKVPKTGDQLSILGFGCMRLPLSNEKIDEQRATQQIHSAIDQGVNYLDTAWMYHGGQSEPFLGRALAGGYREKVKLATKLPSWMVKQTEEMDEYLNAQLEKLRCEQIDYYLLHSLNGEAWDTLVSLGVLEFLDRAKADGRIVNAGFSFHGLLPDFKRIVDGYDWEFCQIQYNYLDIQHQAGTEGLEYAAAKQLGVIIMEPLRGGNLGLEPAPEEVDTLWQQAANPRPPVEWALRWIWNHPEVTVVLSGMNEETHIDQNLRIAADAHPQALKAAEMELVARVGGKYREIRAVDCTGCGYCQPCPSGVNIPSCFDVYNTLKMFRNPDAAKLSYVIRLFDLDGKDHGYASGCTQCGECLDKCPQDLEIPDLLKFVAEAFETDDLAQREAMVRQFFQVK